MKNLEVELKHKQRDVEKIERKKERAEEALKDKKKEQGKYNRDLAKIEQDIREVVSDKCQTFLALIQIFWNFLWISRFWIFQFMYQNDFYI